MLFFLEGTQDEMTQRGQTPDQPDELGSLQGKSRFYCVELWDTVHETGGTGHENE